MEMIVDSNDTLCYRAINWLIESSNKIAVLKALPLSEKKKHILASMPWDQGNFLCLGIYLVDNISKVR